MATATRGCLGKIKLRDLAASADSESDVGGLQGYTISQEAEELDSSEIGTCETKSETGKVTRSVSVNGFWDPASGANQGEIDVANKVHLEVYPAGDGSGATFYSTGANGATVTSYEQAGDNDSLVTFSATFKINGSWTEATVA